MSVLKVGGWTNPKWEKHKNTNQLVVFLMNKCLFWKWVVGQPYNHTKQVVVFLMKKIMSVLEVGAPKRVQHNNTNQLVAFIMWDSFPWMDLAEIQGLETHFNPGTNNKDSSIVASWPNIRRIFNCLLTLQSCLRTLSPSIIHNLQDNSFDLAVKSRQHPACGPNRKTKLGDI